MPSQISQLRTGVVYSNQSPVKSAVPKITQLSKLIIWSRPGAVVPPVLAVSQVKALVITTSRSRNISDARYIMSTCVSEST